MRKRYVMLTVAALLLVLAFRYVLPLILPFVLAMVFSGIGETGGFVSASEMWMELQSQCYGGRSFLRYCTGGIWHLSLA